MLSWIQEFNANLSDFGLAKAGPTGDHTHVSTQVVGTQGYAAPEYLATGLNICSVITLLFHFFFFLCICYWIGHLVNFFNNS